MVTYVLIHGAAHGAWCWDLLVPELRRRGHAAVSMDLPVDDRTAGLQDYAGVVIAAVEAHCRQSQSQSQGQDYGPLVVVAHSMGALVAPLVCARLPVERLILLAAMVPAPGQTGQQMFAESGADAGEPPDDGDVFYHDAPPALAEAARAKLRHQCGQPMREPVTPWPDIPLTFLLCREDRIIPASWLRRVVPQRLGITPDEIDGSHSPFLSRPAELADRLASYL